MILDWLKRQENFTLIDKRIANFFLKDDKNWQQLSIRSLAKLLFVSPSTITRFCQKGGFSGFVSFKETLEKENKMRLEQLGKINPNLPFEFGDNKESIAKKLQKLEIEAIKETSSLLNFSDLDTITKLVNTYETICVYTLGDLGPLESFKNKFSKIGKCIIIENMPLSAYNYVRFNSKRWLFILISYSGETPDTIKIGQELRKNHGKMIAITSVGKNTLSELSDINLNLATGEKLKNNFGNFSTSISEMYLLDLIYSYCFTDKFIENYKRKIEVANEYEKFRKSNNPLIRD